MTQHIVSDSVTVTDDINKAGDIRINRSSGPGLVIRHGEIAGLIEALAAIRFKTNAKSV